MKRLCVACIIFNGRLFTDSTCILLGRRNKEPNKGFYVLPGGGVEEGEPLEEALQREILEETGLQLNENPFRWNYISAIELQDRIILLTRGTVDKGVIKASSDLYDVDWFNLFELPSEMSPVCIDMLKKMGYIRST